MKRCFWVTVLLSALALGPFGVSAQDATPTSQAGTSLLDYLPNPGAFGDGWILMVPANTTNGNPDVWAARANAVYAGPDGSRVTLGVRFVRPERAAIVAAATSLDQVMSGFVYGQRFDGGHEVEEATIPGCDETQRATGLTEFEVPSAFTACSVGLDVLLYAQVSGPPRGTSTTADSDNAIELMLESATS